MMTYPSRWTATQWSARASWKPRSWHTRWWRLSAKLSTACAATAASTRAAHQTTLLRTHPLLKTQPPMTVELTFAWTPDPHPNKARGGWKDGQIICFLSFSPTISLFCYQSGTKLSDPVNPHTQDNEVAPKYCKGKVDGKDLHLHTGIAKCCHFE